MGTKGKYPQNYIKQMREQRGLSLRDLAEKIGVHHQTLSNLELSKAELSVAMAKKLAEIFECHPLDITDGPANVAPPATREEKELLEAYRNLTESEQARMLGYAEALKAAEQPVKKK